MNGQRPAPMDADYETLLREAEAWVLESEGEIIGFLVLVVEGDCMLLDNVAVAPDYQGAGAGRHLLTLAERRAIEAGCRVIRLYTNEAMVENQRLYERIGYVKTHRARERGLSRVFFEKAIG